MDVQVTAPWRINHLSGLEPVLLHDEEAVGWSHVSFI